MTLELLYLPGCPNHGSAVDLVRNVLQAEGVHVEQTQTPISSHEEAMTHRFPGSPTLRINGRDVLRIPSGRFEVGFACRTYWINGQPQGLPPRVWVERALREASHQETNQ